MSVNYLEAISLIERLHRRCLEVIKTELDRASVRDINNIQSLILFNIGKEELTVGELTLKGCYHGSNVSYNLKKLVEFGYVSHERSNHDRRSYRVKLTNKGHEVRNLLHQMFFLFSLCWRCQLSTRGLLLSNDAWSTSVY